jgi:PKD repeat protein
MKTIPKVGVILLALCQILFSKEKSVNLSLMDSLVAYYPFDGNANDMSIHNNHGIVKGATLTEDRFGNAGHAYYFDGYDDHIVISDTDILSPVNQKLSIAVWVKVYPPYNRFILYKGSNTYNREYAMGIHADSLSSFQINNQGGYNLNQFGVHSESKVEEGKWFHITGTWDGTNCKIYINGIYENMTTPVVTIGNFNSDLYIGTYGGEINQYAINAVIDDIRIYNRVLSDSEINYLYSHNLSANFSADTTFGVAPLTVKFSDRSMTTDSLNKIKSWQWDFNHDGIIDSEEQNPEWTYLKNGVFTVKLTVTDSLNQAIKIKEKYITVLSEYPMILSITDVPNDQGGWVKVNFARSAYDTDSLVLAKTSSPEMYTVEIDDGSGWTATATTVAYGKSIYSILVPTTKDSTLEDDGLINFRVIAGMEEGNFVSNVMTGYSKDNLQPSTPQDLAGYVTPDEYIKLTWQPVSDKDFKYYKIFKRNDGTLFELFSSTTDTVYIDNTVLVNNLYFYSVKAVDHSGNESDFSNIANIYISDIYEENGLVTQYYLSQNYPNPFNPQTTIKYGLLRQSHVKVTIFDILGHKIKELVNDAQNKGHHQVIWDGKNNFGQVVSTGIYYYKLESENYNSMKKMLFIK